MMFNHLASEVKERNREYIDHWKGIDHDKGGFIDNKEEFLEFMYDMAKYNSVEVSAFELSDGLFYVEPWHNNDSLGIPGRMLLRSITLTQTQVFHLSLTQGSVQNMENLYTL